MGRMQNISKQVAKKAVAKVHVTKQDFETFIDDYLRGAKQQHRGDVMAAVINKFLNKLPDKFKQGYEDGIVRLTCRRT